ncbi:MAG: hypothetical protein AEth_00970 [Candidatus Argoarchaeum ethanivorans]|uniref:Uncharacterized protein n=1 Tax=Candidatus Argoarchaeum ethanivorans TaxID=2608793 RepID=A0A8B3S259_9EURY|nr:MAG: hypothetical protein AEth_00970 [Candidatus Argoarchaeum ethanivorans]
MVSVRLFDVPVNVVILREERDFLVPARGHSLTDILDLQDVEVDINLDCLKNK